MSWEEGRRNREVTREAKMDAYLAAYAECGNGSKAAQAANITYDAVKKWKKDPVYGEEFKDREAIAKEQWRWISAELRQIGRAHV